MGKPTPCMNVVRAASACGSIALSLVGDQADAGGPGAAGLGDEIEADGPIEAGGALCGREDLDAGTVEKAAGVERYGALRRDEGGNRGAVAPDLHFPAVIKRRQRG